MTISLHNFEFLMARIGKGGVCNWRCWLGYQEVSEGSTNVQKATYEKNKKNDCKALFLLHQHVEIANPRRFYCKRGLGNLGEVLYEC
ncbi:hypothetical protein CR513_61298, partial [Mucuna pruriens]